MPDSVLVDHVHIQQGDDEPLTWSLTINGAPVDLSGYSVVAQVRRRAEATSPVLNEWSTADGTAELADSTVSLLVDDSESWTWTFGFYDIHVTDFAGRTRVPIRGSMTVIPAVTD